MVRMMPCPASPNMTAKRNGKVMMVKTAVEEGKKTVRQTVTMRALAKCVIYKIDS
jgi:hypothetical protein